MLRNNLLFNNHKLITYLNYLKKLLSWIIILGIIILGVVPPHAFGDIFQEHSEYGPFPGAFHSGYPGFRCDRDVFTPGTAGHGGEAEYGFDEMAADIRSGIETFRVEQKNCLPESEGCARQVVEKPQIKTLTSTQFAAGSFSVSGFCTACTSQPHHKGLVSGDYRQNNFFTGLSWADTYLFGTYRYEENGTPVFLKSDKLFTADEASGFYFRGLGKSSAGNFRVYGAEETALAFLHLNRGLWSIENGFSEFRKKSITEDQSNGSTHIKFGQLHRNIPFWGKEIIVHLDEEGDVYLVSGRVEPTPAPGQMPQITAREAAEILIDELNGAVANGQPKLYYYNYNFTDEEGFASLVYHVEVFIDNEYWHYFVDAVTGRIVDNYPDARYGGPNNLHFRVGAGIKWPEYSRPVSGVFAEVRPNDADTANKSETGLKLSSSGVRFDASGINLKEETVSFSAWHSDGVYYMIDTSMGMAGQINPQLPDKVGSGNIIIYDALRTGPKNWQASIASSDNAHSGWDPAAVSMIGHMRAAYKYYKNEHNRDSYDNQGGNITALVNIGTNYNNAFSNPATNILGFGSGILNNIAIALDMAVHEYTHSVVDHSANFEYRYQPGALHEAFADIMACMIDHDNWLIGEDIYSAPPIRSIENPPVSRESRHYGPLPMHMDDYYNLQVSQGLGGVHVNCTIPAHAAYLIAEGFGENSGLGRKDTAEIFYRALTLHLTRQSQFIDAALAVIQSTAELYGYASDELKTVKAAWAKVGLDPGYPDHSGDEPVPIQPVEGDENYLFLFGNWYAGNNEIIEGFNGPYLGLRYLDDHKNSIYEYVSQKPVWPGRPVVIDNGERVLFINEEGELCVADLFSQEFKEEVLTDSEKMKIGNIAGSRNGRFLAYTLWDREAGSLTPYIYVLDLHDETSSYNRSYHIISTTTESYSEEKNSGSLSNDNPDLINSENDYGADEKKALISPLYVYTIEFTPRGDSIVFDALYEVEMDGTTEFNYWNIGILDIRTGITDHLIRAPRAGVNVANATVANTRPHIIAYDMVDFRREISKTMVINMKTGVTGEVARQEWPDRGWLNEFYYPGVGLPSFTSDDSAIILQRYRYYSVNRQDYLDNWYECDIVSLPLFEKDGEYQADGDINEAEILAGGHDGPGEQQENRVFAFSRAFRRGEAVIAPWLEAEKDFEITAPYPSSNTGGEGVPKQLIIHNTGNYPVVVERCLLTGKDNANFSYKMAGGMVNPGRLMRIQIMFNPERAGEHNAELTVFTNSIEQPELTITLRGIAIEEDILLGDVNGDGIVNVSDAILILRSIVGLYVLNEAEEKRGDVNKDGLINITDAIQILRIVVGLYTAA